MLTSRRKLLAIFSIIILAISLPSVVIAADSQSTVYGDRVVFGGNFRLRDGQIHEGSLLAFGGSIIIEEGAVITGDLLLLGGNLVLKGSVGRSVIVLGGVGEIEETAIIAGDLISPGTAIDISDLAEIGGQIYIEDQTVFIPEIPEFQIDPITPIYKYRPSTTTTAIWFLIRMLAFGALAIFVLMFLPNQTEQIRKVLVSHPVSAGGFGLLSFVMILPVSLLAITIILAPLSFIYWMVVFCGVLLGWIVVGLELGNRIAVLVKREWSPAVCAGIGTISLGAFATVIGLVFWGFFGFIFAIVVGSVGLGAVLMTRFGTKDYPKIEIEDTSEVVPT